MSQLTQSIGLVDNLTQFAPAEEIVDAARYALGINQIRNPQGMLCIPLHAHAFLDGPAQLEQALPDFIGSQLLNCAQPSVAQMVNIVHLTFIVAQSHYVRHRLEKIFGSKCCLTLIDRLIEGPVYSEPANLAQTVTVRIKKLLCKKGLCLVLVGRIARPQSYIEFQQGLFMALAIVQGKSIQNQDVPNIVYDFNRRL